MPLNVPRKRSQHTQDDDAAFPSRGFTEERSFSDWGRRGWFPKWIWRRIRLLISLFRRSPYLLALTALLVCLSIRLFLVSTKFSSEGRPSDQTLRTELTRSPPPLFKNADLVEEFAVEQIHRLYNARETPDGVCIDATLKDGSKALVRIESSSVSESASLSASAPRAHKLARLLDLHHIITPSYEIQLPIVLPESVADRYLGKFVLRACGFRSRTKVPYGAVVRACVMPVKAANVQLLSVLDTPVIEPYDWQSRFPTSRDCLALGDVGPTASQTNLELRRNCRHLVEALLVVYLAGCAPLGNSDLVQWRGDGRAGQFFQIGFARRCFAENRANDVSRDILFAYIERTCLLPLGIISRAKALHGLRWGISRRANVLIQQVSSLTKDRRGDCGKKGWSFYDAHQS